MTSVKQRQLLIKHNAEQINKIIRSKKFYLQHQPVYDFAEEQSESNPAGDSSPFGMTPDRPEEAPPFVTSDYNQDLNVDYTGQLPVIDRKQKSAMAVLEEKQPKSSAFKQKNSV